MTGRKEKTEPGARLVLGITGGIGAGKSRILAYFKEVHGAEIIEADRVAGQLEEPGQPGLSALVGLFGADILEPDGSLCREALSRRIFSDAPAREAVNAALHPLTWDRVSEKIRESTGSLILVESALFTEQSRALCDRLIFVDAPPEVRIARLMKNRGYSREKCLAILKNQRGSAYFQELSDYVLENGGAWEEARRQADGILREIREELQERAAASGGEPG